MDKIKKREEKILGKAFEGIFENTRSKDSTINLSR